MTDDAPRTPESVDYVESRIARDLVKHALYAAPIAIVAVGIWRGVDAWIGGANSSRYMTGWNTPTKTQTGLRSRS